LSTHFPSDGILSGPKSQPGFRDERRNPNLDFTMSAEFVQCTNIR
jgi:hypothetical protein